VVAGGCEWVPVSGASSLTACFQSGARSPQLVHEMTQNIVITCRHKKSSRLDSLSLTDRLFFTCDSCVEA
jgi:hypothetical protein